MQASPSTDVDCSYRVPVPCPSTVRTDIVAVICRVESEAGRTLVARIGRVYPCHGDAWPRCFVGDEGGELMERPGGNHALVFAGLRPTAFACRALADASQLLHADDAHALLLGMRDDLVRELMVGAAHPASLFALTLTDGADFLGFLYVFSARVELAWLVALLACIGDETMALVHD